MTVFDSLLGTRECLLDLLLPHNPGIENTTTSLVLPAFIDVRSHQHFGPQERCGKTDFQTGAPPGHEHLFDLTAPGLCDPSIPDDVQRQFRFQASHPLAQNRRRANV